LLPKRQGYVDLSALPRKVFPTPPSSEADDLTAESLEEAKLNEANLLNRILHHDLEARRTYGNRAFWLVVSWLGCVLMMLLLQGFFGHGKAEITGSLLAVPFKITEPSVFSLSDPVLIALISGTTISVLGIFAAVMNYLFPKRDKEKRGE
jgi:hypothetical protein